MDSCRSISVRVSYQQPAAVGGVAAVIGTTDYQDVLNDIQASARQEPPVFG